MQLRCLRQALLIGGSVTLFSVLPMSAATDGSPVDAGFRCAPLRSSETMVDDQSTDVLEDGSRPRDASLSGRWRELPRSPFAAWSNEGLWTGELLVVVDTNSRRAAGYDPAERRWTRFPDAPQRLAGAAALWTGEEIVVVARARDGVRAMALDPDQATWRELTTPPPELDSPGAAVWTGDAVVAVASGPHELPTTSALAAAAYDPVADCWMMLPGVPGGPQLRSLHATDHGVLAVTGGNEDDLVSVALLDPLSGTWSIAAPSGLYDEGSAGVWTGDELVILAGQPNDAVIRNAAYDPATDRWRVLQPECATSTGRRAIWTGQLIVSESRWAVEPNSATCVRLPARQDRTRGDPVRVWAGDRIIEWSGSQGDLITPLPDGIEYRPR